MKIYMLPVGELQSNCIVVVNEETKQAVIVDPGAEAGKIMKFIEQHELKVEAILLTHGHADHIDALDKVREQTKAKVYIHPEDAIMLTDATKNLSVFIGGPRVFKPAEEMLADGQSLSLAGLDFYVLHTPGHTPGGCCFMLGEHVITGDTIFRESIGRTDFPGGSHKQLLNSIRQQLFGLPETTQLYPGHGPATDVAYEKKYNPFL